MEGGSSIDVPLSDVPLTGVFGLTRREEQVLVGASRGLILKQVAHELGISTNTASIHSAAVRRKVGTRTTLGAVVRYLEERGRRG